jgi:hypothetical protein
MGPAIVLLGSAIFNSRPLFCEAYHVPVPAKAALRLAIWLVVAGAALVIVFVAATVIVWWHEDPRNAQRLKILQADPILRCDVSGTKVTPWHEQEQRNADRAGTTKGIGWGGRAETSVTRLYSLSDADAASVVDAFAACAQASGWTVAKPPAWASRMDARRLPLRLSATKSFPDGCTARLSVYVVERYPSSGQPMVLLDLRADPI